MPWISQKFTKVILKNCQKFEKNFPLTVKNEMSKVFNILWYKVLLTQISYSYKKKYDPTGSIKTKHYYCYIREKNRKMPIKSVEMNISKKRIEKQAQRRAAAGRSRHNSQGEFSTRGRIFPHDAQNVFSLFTSF